MFSKLILVALLAAGASASPVAVNASNDYYFSSLPATFLQGWGYCKNDNLKFVSLPTAAENDALAKALDALGASTANFWIGGLYIRNGFLSKWYWVDGQDDFDYVNWSSTPTPSTSYDNCVIFSYSAATKKGTWTFGNCSTSEYFICAY